MAIVRALAMHPDLLLLDEITSALDPELVAEVLGVVRELATGGMTMLIATHEMGFARDIANRVCFLDAGRILEEGPPERIFRQPTEARTRQFLDRVIAAGRSRRERLRAARADRAAAGVDEDGEQALELGRRRLLALGVALDTEHEPAVGRLERLDEVPGRARRPGAGDQARREVGRHGRPGGGRC